MTITQDEARNAAFLLQQYFEQLRKSCELATVKQRQLIEDLAKRKGLELPDLDKMTKAEASEWISKQLKP